MRRRAVLALSLVAAVQARLPARAATRASAEPAAKGLALVMVDRPGCAWCRAWRREVLPGYAAHPAGRRAPLAVVPLDGPWPDGLAIGRAPAVTPTFLLLRDRVEIARIEGYPGPGPFWSALESLLARAEHGPPR